MKKIISGIAILILCFALTACGDEAETEEPEKATEAEREVTIMDCVENISVEAVEDGVIYWNVKFNEQFNAESFDGMDFFEIIKACLSKEESKDEAITDFSVFAYDSNDMLRFSWGVPDKSYDPIHESTMRTVNQSKASTS